MLAEDCPIILTFNEASYVLVQPWAPVTNTNLMLEGGFKYASIDPVLRAQKRREWNPVAKWPIPVVIAMILAGAYYAIRVNRRRYV